MRPGQCTSFLATGKAAGAAVLALVFALAACCDSAEPQEAERDVENTHAVDLDSCCPRSIGDASPVDAEYLDAPIEQDVGTVPSSWPACSGFETSRGIRDYTKEGQRPFWSVARLPTGPVRYVTGTAVPGKYLAMGLDVVGDKAWESAKTMGRVTLANAIGDGLVALSGPLETMGFFTPWWMGVISTDGTLLWQKHIQWYGHDKSFRVFRLLPTSAGGAFFLMGAYGTKVTSKGWLSLISKKGTLKWAIAPDLGPGSHATVADGVALPGNALVIAGILSEGGMSQPEHTWMANVNAQGFVVWARLHPSFGTSLASPALTIVKVPGGDYVLAAAASGPGYHFKLLVVRTSETGEVKWSRTFPSWAARPVSAARGGVDGVLVAATSQWVSGKDDYHSRLALLDGLGRMLWDLKVRPDNPPYQSEMWAVFAGPGCGWTAFASTEPPGSPGPAYAMILNVGPFGFTDDKAAGVCAEKTWQECTDADVCTRDGCDPEVGCTHTPWPDETPCGVEKVCRSGECVSK